MATEQSDSGVPDPASSYERARPEKEAGMGRLDMPPAVPDAAPDREGQAVKNAQEPRQVNAEQTADERQGQAPGERAGPTADEDSANRPRPAEQPDHSMLEEEPDGWDLAPNDIHDPRKQRHPRREGRGGLP